jgi:RNA-binding protein 39
MDGENGGLGRVSRVELMAKLASNRADIQFPGQQQASANRGVDSGLVAKAPAPQPTRNCLLRNMFDPLNETEPDWDQEIKADVLDECQRFGPVKHLHVDKTSPDGKVYLRFDSVDSCRAAVQALNGRWFAKKQINATFIVDGIYEAQFPESKFN